jgi:hypothetical protein
MQDHGKSTGIDSGNGDDTKWLTANERIRNLKSNSEAN